MGTITRGAKAGGGTGFNAGQTGDPAEVNTDINTLYTEINGNLDNDNIDAAAAIVTSKLAFSGARVTNSGTISLLTATWTLMTFDTESYDTDAYHSTVSNTGRLTAPTTGKYLVTGSVGFNSEASGLDCLKLVAVRLNAAGSSLGGTLVGGQYVGSPANTSVYNVSISIVLALTATDYVELFAYQSSGETINALLSSAPSAFAISRLGA